MRQLSSGHADSPTSSSSSTRIWAAETSTLPRTSTRSNVWAVWTSSFPLASSLIPTSRDFPTSKCTLFAKSRVDSFDFARPTILAPHISLAVVTVLTWHEFPDSVIGCASKWPDDALQLRELHRQYGEACWIGPLKLEAERDTDTSGVRRHTKAFREFHGAFSNALNAMRTANTLDIQSTEHRQELGFVFKDNGMVLVEHLDSDPGLVLSFNRIFLATKEFLHHCLEARELTVSSHPRTCSPITIRRSMTTDPRLGRHRTFFGPVPGQDLSDLIRAEIHLDQIGGARITTLLDALSCARALRILKLTFESGGQTYKSAGAVQTARQVLDYFSGQKTTAWQVLRQLAVKGLGLGAHDLGSFIGSHAKTLCSVQFVNCGLTLQHVISMFTVLEPWGSGNIEVSALDAELSIHYEDLLLLSATSSRPVPERLLQLRSPSYASKTIQIIPGNDDQARRQQRNWWPTFTSSECHISASTYCRSFRFYQDRYSTCWL